MNNMEDIFITDIEIKKVRHLQNLKIHISDTQIKHLILTGKNGSGKTSVLEEMREFLNKIVTFYKERILLMEETDKLNNEFKKIDEKTFYSVEGGHKAFKLKDKLNSLEKTFKEKITNLTKQNILFTLHNLNLTNNTIFISPYFPSKRPLENMIDYSKVEKGFKLELPTNLNDKLNKYFLYYIVKKQNAMGQYYLKGDVDEVEKIKEWFKRFEKELNKLFNEKEKIKLDYEVEEEKFYILQNGKERFDFNAFSDGYKSILAIVSEIIMQSDINKKGYEEIQGIVLIDEVETHLHLELQKQILPFLTTLFPKIQFIVTTHSPFVLNSIENAVVYDLEKQEEIDSSRLKNASYSQIVKNYFEIDSEYSKILEKKIEKYEKLVKLFEEENLNEENEKELFELDIELDKLSPMLSDEIYLRFKEAQEKIVDND